MISRIRSFRNTKHVLTGDQQKLSAGLTSKTERSLAERAGHLELLAGGKKSSKNSNSGPDGKGKGGKAIAK